MMNKGIRNILFGCAALLLASSCVEEGQFDKPVFASIKPYYLNVSADGANNLASSAGSAVINVESIETDWKITGMPAWIQVEPSSGSNSAQVTVTYSANSSTTADRSAVLSLVSTDSEWNYSTTFTVSQKRSLCYAYAEQDSKTIDGNATNLKVNVTTNTTAWDAVLLADMAGWATVTKSSNSFTLAIQANVGNVARTGTVQIKTADSNSTFIVTQRPAGISASLEAMNFGVKGGTQSVTVTSQANWTAQTASAWIDVTPANGAAGEVTVAVKTQPNYSMQTRKGYVYLVLSAESKIEIPVEQDCVSFSLGSYAMSFGASPQQSQLDVNTNVGWSVVAGFPEWLSFSPQQADEGTQVTVSAADNNSTSGRNASFGIGLTVLDYVLNVDVSQEGHSFQADSTALEFSDKKGIGQIAVQSDGTWTASSPDAWISLSPATHTGNGTLAVSVTENTTASTRIGTVNINLGATVYSVRIIQQGKYITVSGNLFNLASAGGQVQVDLTTNDGWTADAGSGSAWVSLSSTSGEGDCHLTITVAPNKSVTPRNDTVTIQPVNLNPVKIVIQQAARYMNLSTSSIQFFEKGGTSDNIQVETDGLVQATTADDWLTVNTIENGLFTVTALANPTHFERTGTVTVTMTDLDEGQLVKTITATQDKRTDDVIAIPDAAFKTVLLGSGFDLDNDQDISLDEAVLITAIDAAGKGIASLTGIEYMTALQSLDCSNNSLTAIDLTSNTALTALNVTGNADLKQVIVPANYSKESYMAAQFDRHTYLVPAGNITVFNVGDVEFSMITVPGGTFQMGATDEQGTDAKDAEKPVHSVTLTTFSIGQTEITQALWKAVMGTNPSEVEADDMPVSQLSWSMARQFILRLNELTGQQFRFATEAEWEFAARGGSWSKGYKYSGGDDMDNVGWHNMNRGSHFYHPVATAYPNELGLYDMSGNVIELCMDWDGSYTDAAQTDPTGAASGEKHIIRGGSWRDEIVNCRISARASVLDKQYRDVGLRIVLGGADIPDSWYGQWVTIPDASFSEALMWTADTDEDNHLTIGELMALKSFSVGGFGDVADMTGLEYMTGLTSLNCSGNLLTTLDVSKNVNLTSLLCSNNNLTELDISNNTKLNILNAQGNAGLTTVYVWPGFNAADHPNFKIPSTAQYVVKQ